MRWSLMIAAFSMQCGFAEETTPASDEVSAEVTADADNVAEDAAEAEVPPIAQDTRGGAV